MPLPTCECIRGLPQADKLDAIYCALLEIAAAGGSVNINDVEGVSDFWKAGLATTPASNAFLTTDINGDLANITAPVGLLGIAGFDGGGAPISTDPSASVTTLLSGGTPFSGTVNPVTEIEVNNGIISNAS